MDEASQPLGSPHTSVSGDEAPRRGSQKSTGGSSSQNITSSQLLTSSQASSPRRWSASKHYANRASVTGAMATSLGLAGPKEETVADMVGPGGGPFIVDYLDYKDPLPSRLSRSFKESVGLSRGKEINGRTMVPRVSEKFVGGDKLPYNDGNKIRTQRFGSYMVQWLPHSVYFQFRRSANIYFAIICVLQMMPFSPKMPEPTVMTFVAVLIWTAAKDRYEDYQREQSDKKENNRVTDVLQKDRTWKKTTWANVKANDIVKVKKDEHIPADMVVIGTAHGGHIDTKNLDGETNLKLKMAHLGTKELTEKSEALEKLTIFAEPPHENMAVFKGSFRCPGNEQTALSLDNLVFRGCTLRNTDWVFGMAVYTGADSKAMLNSREAPAKMPNMQHVFIAGPGVLNKLLYGLFGILFVTVLICAVCAMVWESRQKDVTNYLQVFDTDGVGEFDLSFYGFIIKVGVFIVSFSHLVPMSLYVALEVTKLILAYFVTVDEQMKYEDTYALCRNSDLMEELGQVEIVFSDKTGTLTCNKMEYVRGSVDGKVYGPATNEQLELARAKLAAPDAETPQYAVVNDVEPYKDMFEKSIAYAAFSGELLISRTTENQAALDYFLLLAVCHAVVIDPDSGKYQGSSPDEVALVQGAAAAGVKLIQALNGFLEIQLADGTKRAYQVHEQLEFDSDRKRMSVIVENKTEQKMEIMTKGADMMVLELLKREKVTDEIIGVSADTQRHLLEFASEGLRTLVCAKKTLKDLREDSKDMQNGCWYDGWKDRFHKASLAIDDKEAQIAACATEIETDLDYVGVTAVEDMLQEGVPEAIATLRSARIRVWVLTGDKVETAIDIGYSCRLLDKSMVIKKLTDLSDVASIEAALLDVLDVVEKGSSVGLALDGYTMTTITSSGDVQLIKLFFKVVMSVNAVICCRVAPKQKAFVVKVIRQNLPELITLSIGDGANDVAMIQEAHVGVGIRGVEGTQAVQASDFAISQFRFLEPLILDHGRGAYRRVATFMCYYFYKNIALTMCDAYWTAFSGYSGQVLFPVWFSTCYNGMWTSFASIFSFSFDGDVSGRVARANPYLYQAGPCHVFFNGKVFGQWVVLAIYHGFVCFAIPFFGYAASPVSGDGIVGGFWWCSVLMFTCMVLVVNLRLLVITTKWIKLSLGVLVFNLIFYFLCLAFMTHTEWFAQLFQWNVYSMMGSIYGSGAGWIITIGTVMLCLLPDFLLEAWNMFVSPTPLHIQMYHERKNLDYIELKPVAPDTNPLPEPLKRDISGTTAKKGSLGGSGGGAKTNTLLQEQQDTKRPAAASGGATGVELSGNTSNPPGKVGEDDAPTVTRSGQTEVPTLAPTSSHTIESGGSHVPDEQ